MKIITFYHFDSDPRFPPFLLYVRWKSGVIFLRRCFRDGVQQGYVYIDCDTLRFSTSYMHKKLHQVKENQSDSFQRTSHMINVNAQFEVLTSLHTPLLTFLQVLFLFRIQYVYGFCLSFLNETEKCNYQFLHPRLRLTFPSRCYMWNMDRIVLTASEEKSFENVHIRMDGGRGGCLLIL